MCEEIKGASTIVPKSLMISIAINGVLGLGILLAALFCIGNVDNALNTPTKFPYIEIFAQATKSNRSTTGMVVLIVVLMTFATTAIVTAASRMMWAFARDQGLPGSGFLSKVMTKSLYTTEKSY